MKGGIRVAINPLKRLYELGQSPWYDNIDRGFIVSGGLKGLIEKGIKGLTTNPTIFEKSVSASDVYGQQIRHLAKEKKSAKEIYDEITIFDVQKAADLLKKIYASTNRIDGYVSIEVYPEYTHDPESTVRYAKALHKRIERENIMIKVPGTKEGCEAVRVLIREGINVNVTLLFSLGHYERAALAYIEGLKERLKDGKEIGDVLSVASVFVSRVDTRIDKILEDKREDSLKGKIAAANVKMIYQKFKRLFDDANFGVLREKGGHIQRPLWASTSTKNPAYSDVKYIEELIGKDTINTLPHATAKAFLDRGNARLTIEENLDDAKDALKRLEALNINLALICEAIQDEGVSAFQRSFDKLINTIQRETGK